MGVTSADSSDTATGSTTRSATTGHHGTLRSGPGSAAHDGLARLHVDEQGAQGDARRDTAPGAGGRDEPGLTGGDPATGARRGADRLERLEVGTRFLCRQGRGDPRDQQDGEDPRRDEPVLGGRVAEVRRSALGLDDVGAAVGEHRELPLVEGPAPETMAPMPRDVQPEVVGRVLREDQVGEVPEALGRGCWDGHDDLSTEHGELDGALVGDPVGIRDEHPAGGQVVPGLCGQRQSRDQSTVTHEGSLAGERRLAQEVSVGHDDRPAAGSDRGADGGHGADPGAGSPVGELVGIVVAEHDRGADRRRGDVEALFGRVLGLLVDHRRGCQGDHRQTGGDRGQDPETVARRVPEHVRRHRRTRGHTLQRSEHHGDGPDQTGLGDDDADDDLDGPRRGALHGDDSTGCDSREGDREEPRRAAGRRALHPPTPQRAEVGVAQGDDGGVPRGRDGHGRPEEAGRHGGECAGEELVGVLDRDGEEHEHVRDRGAERSAEGAADQSGCQDRPPQVGRARTGRRDHAELADPTSHTEQERRGDQQDRLDGGERTDDAEGGERRRVDLDPGQPAVQGAADPQAGLGGEGAGQGDGRERDDPGRDGDEHHDHRRAEAMRGGVATTEPERDRPACGDGASSGPATRASGAPRGCRGRRSCRRGARPAGRPSGRPRRRTGRRGSRPPRRRPRRPGSAAAA